MSKGLKAAATPKKPGKPSTRVDYDTVLTGVVALLDTARRAAARSVNALMTATYWEIGRRIVVFEQGGEKRAEYGKELLKRLAVDLTARYGRGFGVVNLSYMKRFYQCWPLGEILQTVSEESLSCSEVIPATMVTEAGFAASDLPLRHLVARFPLPWSHYLQLLSVKNPVAREFYEAEALRGGWSVRQLKRQIDTQFYERTALSKNKAAMLTKGAKPKPEDAVGADEEIKDPLLLEFLGLKDEYSETELEAALIRHLENFLLELGNEFAFVGRQRRLRIDDEWFRVDLLFFHRRLRCLVVIDLKLGRFTHADAGQMHLYLNYAREHWVQPDENPPVGIILCAGKGEALVRYATEGLPNQVVVREYLTALPEEKLLADEIGRMRRVLERRT